MSPTSPKPFDLDAAIVEATGAPFVFTYKGKDWSLPSMQSLAAPEVITAVAGGDLEFAVRVFELAFGEQWGDFYDGTLPMAGLTKLSQAYLDHSGVSAGESSASTS